MIDRNLLGFVRQKQNQRSVLMQHKYFSSTNIYLVSIILAFILYHIDCRYDLSHIASKFLLTFSNIFNAGAGYFLDSTRG